MSINLKPFEEFKASLTQADKEYINGINDENTSIDIDLANPDGMNKAAAFIAGYSFKMNLRLLELYHEWLAKQL